MDKYTQLKQNGNITITKQVRGFLVSKKRYDPETGQELDPILEMVDITSLTEKRDALQADLDSIQALLDDVIMLDNTTPAV